MGYALSNPARGSKPWMKLYSFASQRSQNEVRPSFDGRIADNAVVRVFEGQCWLINSCVKGCDWIPDIETARYGDLASEFTHKGEPDVERLRCSKVFVVFTSTCPLLRQCTMTHSDTIFASALARLRRRARVTVRKLSNIPELSQIQKLHREVLLS